MAKLVVFYSRADENYFGGQHRYIKVGNTEKAAKTIAQITGADLFKIEQKVPYAADYNTCVAEARKDFQENARPELKVYLQDVDVYDHIFVCGPCWCGTYPMAVFTQLEKLDFTGRKVMGLMTHEGSGLGSSEQGLKKACNGAIFGTSLAIHGAEAKASEQKIAEWAVRSIG